MGRLSSSVAKGGEIAGNYALKRWQIDDFWLNGAFAFLSYNATMPLVDTFVNHLTARGELENRFSSALMCAVFLGDLWFLGYQKIYDRAFKGRFARLKKGVLLAGYLGAVELGWSTISYALGKHTEGQSLLEYLNTVKWSTCASASFFPVAGPIINAAKYAVTNRAEYFQKVAEPVRKMLGCTLKTQRARLAVMGAYLAVIQGIGTGCLLYAQNHNHRPNKTLPCPAITAPAVPAAPVPVAP